MENKVLVKLFNPELDIVYDVFFPINEIIWKVKKICIKSISDLSNTNLDFDDDYILINKDTGRIYKNNEIVFDTDIRNGVELIICSK